MHVQRLLASFVTAGILTTIACKPSPSAEGPTDPNASTSSDDATPIAPGTGVTSASSDQPPGPHQLDAVLEPIQAKYELPALAGAVVDSTGAIALGAVGVRDLRSQVPVTVDDRWHLGSNTKAMTATLAAISVERDELAWDWPLERAFPGVTMHSDWGGVTLYDWLIHRGGAPESIPESFPDTWQSWWGGGDTKSQRASLIAELLASPRVATPGAFVYSNAGYVGIGGAIETTTARSWEEVIHDRLFQPLGMSECGFGAPPAGHPVGHSADLKPVPTLDNPPALGPAGTVHCTLQSWARFVRLHLVGPAGESSLLPASAFVPLHEPKLGEYGGGWIVSTEQPWAQGPALTHSGTNTAWFATVWVAPAIGKAYLAVTNWAGGEAPIAVNAAILALIRFDLAR
ncbi:MAG: beta-lactamase family protein [Myxococcales bacterium FL481]|nr:MAG: beta-lactamase family protein [Myxococcales bacterium FL481]